MTMQNLNVEKERLWPSFGEGEHLALVEHSQACECQFLFALPSRRDAHTEVGEMSGDKA